MGDTGLYLVGQPPVLFTATFVAKVISSLSPCCKEGRRQTHSMLTKTSHFTLNKSGIAVCYTIVVLYPSLPSLAGQGGKGIGTNFQKITLSIRGFWPIQSTPTSHKGVAIMQRVCKYIVGHISIKMRYDIIVYVNY